MRPHRFSFTSVALGVTVFSVLSLPPAANAGRPQEVIDALCLSHLFAGASKLERDTVKQLGKCHSQRLNGKLPASTDCNAESNAPWGELRARDANSLRTRARKRCSVAVASPPDAMGFTDCPAPCDAAVPSIASYADVAECLICQAYDIAMRAAENVFGTPSLPAGQEEACFARLTRVIRHYIGARLKAQRACQMKKDRGRLPASVDCRTYDATGIIARASSLIAPGVAKCSDADLFALDSCGATVNDEAACLEIDLDGAAIELFEAVY